MWDGDISICVSVVEDFQVWLLVISINDNCFGSDCLFYKECFVVKVCKKVMDVDVVIVNYYLFFVDMVVKESGFGEFIFQVEVMIFDEVY